MVPSPSRRKLLARKKAIQVRLRELDIRNDGVDAESSTDGGAKPPPSSSAVVVGPSSGAGTSYASESPLLLSRLPPASRVPRHPPSSAKTDTHWDYTLKEMAWLSADFRSERKRQISQAKKFSNAILQHHATLASKKARERAQAEARVRRLAGRMGRLIQKHYWRKMERVVEYKQRLEGEENRRREMDRRLVFLVRQTERYGESLRGATKSVGSGNDGERKLTIEEVLSQSNDLGRRKARRLGVDYSRLDKDGSCDESSFYGESVARSASNLSASGSEGVDGCYEPSKREMTREARNERKEYDELLQYFREQPVEEVREEVRKLLEERDMDLEHLIQRLIEEGMQAADEGEEKAVPNPMIKVINEKLAQEEDEKEWDARSANKRRVSFAASHQEKIFEPEPFEEVDSGASKDDAELADALRQTGFAMLDDGNHLDNEMSIEAEERIGCDRSYLGEINMLQNESELPVEELMAMFASEGEGGFDADENLMLNDYVGNIADSGEITPHNDGSIQRDRGGAGKEIAPGDKVGKQIDNEEIDSNDRRLEKDYFRELSFGELLNEDGHEQKDDFHPEKEDMDDKATIEAEEKLVRDMSHGQQSNVHGDDVAGEAQQGRCRGAKTRRRRGARTRPRKPTVLLAPLDEDDHEKKNEFHPEKEEQDDETTIEAEEKLGREISYQEEINLLKEENLMTVEELRTMYADLYGGENTPTEDGTGGDDGSCVSLGEVTQLSLAPLDEDDHLEKDEFHLEKEEPDDETTIEAEEKLGRNMSYQDEIALLKKESELSVADLRAMYARLYGEESAHSGDEGGDGGSDAMEVEVARSSLLKTLDEDDHDEKDEFCPEVEKPDDETTIDDEEKLGRDISYAEELDMLKRENEMSVEELLSMYGNMDNSTNEGRWERGKGDAAALAILGRQEDRVDLTPKGLSKRKHASAGDVNNHDDGSPSKKAKPDGADEGISALESLAASDTKAKEMMLTRPFLIASWVKLRAYQHIGLNWLVSIQTRRLNGILADEMGLGKTLQTISMLAYLASYKGIWGPHLIIVPTSCLVNWEVEFKRFCPGLKILCYYGTAKRRKELRTGWTKLNVHHVVITSYQLAVSDAFAFKRKKWYYLILDEAHNIKNFESQRWQTLIGFNTQRRLLLTGTPLQNNLMELWSLLHFLMPHVFTDRKQFSYWFSNPMDSIIEGNTKRNDDMINRLHGIIRPFVLRRLKKDVETQLPGKYEHIVRCQLSRRQMFLYEEFMARSSTRKALQSGGNFMGMMNVLMQLRKVCNHPDLFEPRTVTTSFVMEPLCMTAAACVVNAVESKSALEQLSPSLRLPLWTRGRGTPSFDSSTLVDHILVEQLYNRKTPKETMMRKVMDNDLREPGPHFGMDEGLSSFLSVIRTAEKCKREHRARFMSDINTQRCEVMAFPYSDRMRRAVAVDMGLCDLPVKDELTAVQIAATPLELLDMRKNQDERAKELDEIADKFVFCVPKAGTSKPILFSSNARSIDGASERTLLAKTLKFFSLFKKASSRLTMCLPDKKLVQFDAGKLQTLASLLRKLKQGRHRVLIFTQMSKMLDVLEAFLNLNGHTYLRLDGATDVDRRQRLMDRFNNDPKVFCFILSTRSGGLGINLTGADTVVFYDSDWNPAMDAQAQDRAHRIGQTREVHIYRMVTEHSIEENILTKAKQKKNLDFLVMDEGKFHADANDKTTANDDQLAEDDTAFTKDKLQNILGIHAEDDASVDSNSEDSMSKDQLESAMIAVEDEDDVKAMQNARQEAAEALQEFDETIQYKQDENVPDEMKGKEKKDLKQNSRPSNASEDSTGSDNASDDDDNKEMEKEFAQWQRKVGMDATTIHENLNPLERYGLHIKEQIDPYYSQYYWAEQQRLAQTTELENEWNIEEIEQRKVEEEQKAFEDGDLLCTFPDPEALPRQRQLYIREKARMRSEIMKRKLTGQNWSTKMDERTGNSFWYNTDTGEAIWEKPHVLKMLEAEEVSRAEGWAALPTKPLVNIFEFLIPCPDRISCAETCNEWNAAANDVSFVLHVWPVELGALVMEESKLGKNHFRTISDAMKAALPGDTIELGDGHYFVNDPGLLVDRPIKFVGDEHEPAHVVLELSGEIVWKSFGGWMEGITIRRTRMATGVTPNEILRLESQSRLDMFNCVFDNRGSLGNTVFVGVEARGRWERASISGGSKDRSGLYLKKNAKMELIECIICDNDGFGLFCEDGAVAALSNCMIESNGSVFTKQEDLVFPSAEPSLIMSH